MTSPTPATPPPYTPWEYTPSGIKEAWVRGYVFPARKLTTDFTGAVEVPRDIGRPRALAAEQVDAASPDRLSRILRQPDAEKRRGRDGAFLHGGGRIRNIHIEGKHRTERESRAVHGKRDHRRHQW